MDKLAIFIALGLVVCLVMLIWEIVIPTRKQRIYYSTLGVSLIPVMLAAYTAFRRDKALHQRLPPVVFVATIVGSLFPSWFKCTMAAGVLFMFGWMTRPLTNATRDFVKKKSSDDELDLHTKEPIQDHSENNSQQETTALLKDTSKNDPSKATATKASVDVAMSSKAQHNMNKAAVCVVILTVVMLSENFCIWVVSATFEKGWNPATAPDPLQDNGRRVLQAIFTDGLGMTKKDVVSMRHLWNVQFALVATLGTALNMLDFHPTRQLWSLGCRTLLTLASARFLRTISFLLTVLPSQNKFCYVQHYRNPPPADWWSWFLMGLEPASHGGCNDLIVSGHATVTATVACVAISLADDPLFSVAVSCLLAMDYAVEIFEGFHYSVDMWMGAVLVGLLWRVWKPIEDNNKERNTATLQAVVQRLGHDKMTVKDATKYGIPVVIAFLQVTVLPDAMAHLILVSLLAFGVAQIILYGFQQYTKHLFYCALYAVLGIFL